MSKWNKLTEYLNKISESQNQITLSFSDIENIIGDKLKSSAYNHRAYWGNSRSHSYALSWINAGWETQGDPRKKKLVSYVRKTNSIPQPNYNKSFNAEITSDNKQVCINDRIFEKVCNIIPEKDASNSIKVYYPQTRYNNIKQLPLNPYGQGPFCKFRIPLDWRNKNGVYLIIRNREIVYVGECQDLASRYNTGYGQISPKNCFTKGQPTNCRINNLIFKESNSNSTLELWFHEMIGDKKSRVNIEKELINTTTTKWNKY